jgi:hypothetical protein
MATQELTNVLSREVGIPKSCCAGSDRIQTDLQQRPKTMLLGLPCVHCKAYFEADFEACPICGCKERIGIARGTASLVVM